jgi:predicted permease
MASSLQAKLLISLACRYTSSSSQCTKTDFASSTVHAGFAQFVPLSRVHLDRGLVVGSRYRGEYRDFQPGQRSDFAQPAGADPDRLVLFTLDTPDRHGDELIPRGMYRQINEKSDFFDGFAAFVTPLMSLSTSAGTEPVNGELVSGNFFQTLRVNAIPGRVISAEDERSSVCVIGYDFWQRRFAGNPAVIGRTIKINDQPLTIIGVTPKGFTGLVQVTSIDVSVPLLAPGMSTNISQHAFGRLKPGVTAAQAQPALDALYHQVNTRPNRARVVLQPGRQGYPSLRAEYGRPLGLLIAVTALVLLIACANLINLLLARATGRAKESAVRLALGAGRAWLIRQMLTENLILTFGGAILGVALAYWVDRALLALAPTPMAGGTLPIDVNPDWRVFLFTLAIAALVTLLSGIAPAIQASRAEMGPALKGGTGLIAPGRFSFTNTMVALQVALSLVLLIGSGLFLRSLYNLKSVDPGLDPERLVVLTINPAQSAKDAEIQAVADRAVQRARSLPGVVAVSPALISPLSGEFAQFGIKVPGYQLQPGEAPAIDANFVGPEYFKTLATPLLSGRYFTEQDGVARKVAIVNEKAARQFWPNESPIGKHIGMTAASPNPTDCEVVGVVKNVKTESLREDAPPAVYMPYRQNPLPRVTLHVRVEGDPAPMIGALTREIHNIDPNWLISDPGTMAAQIDRTLALDRLMTTLPTLFGLLAVVLAAVGLYGVMAYSVAARTHEIGIRMALGADRARLLRLVLGRSASIAAVGILAGTPAALWASRAVGSFLFGLTATDAKTYLTVAALLFAVALAATWIPARRASRVDPMVALRWE